MGRIIYNGQESILSPQKRPTSPDIRSTDPGTRPNNLDQRRFVLSPYSLPLSPAHFPPLSPTMEHLLNFFTSSMAWLIQHCTRIFHPQAYEASPALINKVWTFPLAAPTIGIKLITEFPVRVQGSGIIVLLFVDSAMTPSDKDDYEDINPSWEYLFLPQP